MASVLWLRHEIENTIDLGGIDQRYDAALEQFNDVIMAHPGRETPPGGGWQQIQRQGVDFGVWGL